MRMLAALIASGAAAAADAQGVPSPLFADDQPIRISIQGPVSQIARKAENSVQPHPAKLAVAGVSADAHPIMLSARGLSRRRPDVCDFPPLRVEFAQPAPAASLFAGQRRLKLVTHCRPSEGFQQHLLLEYSAYRLFNLLSPNSYRVRLSTIDYSEPDGKRQTSRWGFFIEDGGDVARRNGLSEARVGDRIQPGQLESRQAAKVALFQYMIGNLDWSMRAGPEGEGCCHNSRLFTAPGSPLIPIPYDFDYSGLVDAPYAVPPEGIRVNSVRERVYRGYCRHNAEAVAAAAEFRAKRTAMEAVFGQVPGISAATQRRALSYLGRFFEEIASDESVRTRIIKNCLGG